MASKEYVDRDACPRCGSRSISRKKDSENGRPRVHAEPYTCRSCHAHFDDPDRIQVLVPDRG